MNLILVTRVMQVHGKYTVRPATRHRACRQQPRFHLTRRPQELQFTHDIKDYDAMHWANYRHYQMSPPREYSSEIKENRGYCTQLLYIWNLHNKLK